MTSVAPVSGTSEDLERGNGRQGKGVWCLHAPLEIRVLCSKQREMDVTKRVYMLTNKHKNAWEMCSEWDWAERTDISVTSTELNSNTETWIQTEAQKNPNNSLGKVMMTEAQTSSSFWQISTVVKHPPPVEAGTQRLHFRANTAKYKIQVSSA